jgi:hypothetical protein
MKTVAGLFGALVETRKVIEHLGAAGFNAESVSVISARVGEHGLERVAGAESPRDTVDKRNVPLPGRDMPDNPEPRPVVPPLNPMVPPGPLTTAVEDVEDNSMTARTGVGAVGLHKALVEWGFNHDEVRDFEAAVARGHSLLAVEVIEDQAAGHAADILRQEGAERITVADPFAQSR